MMKDSADNVSLIFVAFKNFEEKMKDINFEYTEPPVKCYLPDDNYDLSEM